MSEASEGALQEAEQESPNPNEFKLETEIEGLPYTFEGVTPEEPTSFELVVGLPVPAWDKIKGEIENKKANDQWFASQYRRLQQALRLGDGRVGSVWVAKARTEDEVPAVGISRIQTDNRYLPEDSEYYNARGVGSFLLDNLCALADDRGWRIYLEPLERDGRLTGMDLVDWYARRGFEFGAGDTEHMHSNSGSMLRLPQRPDMSQAIAAMLAK